MGSNETSTILLFSTDTANSITTCHDLRRCGTHARLDNRALIKLINFVYNISHGVRYMFNHNNLTTSEITFAQSPKFFFFKHIERNCFRSSSEARALHAFGFWHDYQTGNCYLFKKRFMSSVTTNSLPWTQDIDHNWKLLSSTGAAATASRFEFSFLLKAKLFTTKKIYWESQVRQWSENSYSARTFGPSG